MRTINLQACEESAFPPQSQPESLESVRIEGGYRGRSSLSVAAIYHLGTPLS